MKLSVVIPAYNEKDNIKSTIDETLEVVDTISDIDDVQVIVVDDHSDDNTFEVVKSFNEESISCVRLSKRSGSHTAIRAGLNISKGDAVLCISADGQEDVGVIEQMTDKWRNGAKIVWALRRHRDNESWLIRKPAQLFYCLLSWLGAGVSKEIDLSRADFFLLDRKVVEAIKQCAERNTSLFGLLVWIGFCQDFVEYDIRQRRQGKSKWNFSSRCHLAKDWIVAFSGLPLKLMTLLGLFIASVGFLYALFIVAVAILGNPVTGWASTMVVILILGGTQMTMLGVIGEYLWRNLDESRKRPLFFIEKSTEESK